MEDYRDVESYLRAAGLIYAKEDNTQTAIIIFIDETSATDII